MVVSSGCMLTFTQCSRAREQWRTSLAARDCKEKGADCRRPPRLARQGQALVTSKTWHVALRERLLQRCTTITGHSLAQNIARQWITSFRLLTLCQMMIGFARSGKTRNPASFWQAVSG